MEIILCVTYTLFFIFLINKLKFFKIEGVSVKILSVLFIIKIASAFAITLIYTYYYKDNFESDIFKYFEDGKVIHSSIHNNPFDFLRLVSGIGADAPHLDQYYNLTNYWFKENDYNLLNDNRTIIRFNAIALIFSFGYFNVHNIFMAFISFTGFTAIFKIFYNYFQEKRNLLIVSVYLIPSVLIWTSGVLKEGLVMFSLGFLLYYFDKLLACKFQWKYVLGLIFTIFLLFISKFYVLLAIIPGLFSIAAIKLFKNKFAFYIFTSVHVLIFVIFFFFQVVFSHYNLTEIVSKKQHDFINMIDKINSVGSQIDIPALKPSLLSFVKNTPNALVNSFFRPHIFEIKSFMYIVPAIENLLIIIMFLLMIFFYKKISTDNFLWIWFCISFVLILFVLCGLTTPVLGALVRYKVPAIPFLFIIFITFIDLKKIIELSNNIIKWKK
ncbi:MAG: hypothetical protein A2X08_03830 [Bacteroidetes bacterium GWA2_32_17]|nr:MAG: hypothetical protein A2X08_03830 [Bacteroidetes bacterium GWA2_32_17]